MLPNAHLISHSRMSPSMWVTTPLWLSGSWRSFLYSSSVYSFHLSLISFTSVRSLPFLSFIEPIFAWNGPLISLVSWSDLYSFPFYCFPLFLCTDCWWRLSYLSLKLCIQMGISFLFSFAFHFSFFSQIFVRLPQTAILLFWISFSWGWSWFLSPVQCHEPPSIVHQELCLSDLVP